MSNIAVNWSGAEHSVLVWTFPTLYTVDDLYAAGQRSREMLAGVEDAGVDLVLVLSGRGPSYGNLVAALPPDVRRLVCVSRSIAVKVLVDSLRAAGMDAKRSMTLNDAFALLSDPQAAAGD